MKVSIQKFSVTLIVLSAIFVVFVERMNTVHAQNNSTAQERSEQMQHLMKIMQQEEETTEEQETSPGIDTDEDEDDPGPLGRQRILRRKKAHKYYSASASLTFQNTDNVSLNPDPSPQNTDGSRIASVSGNYHFNTSSPYTARASVSYQSAAYRDEEALNYDFFTAGISGRKQLQTPGLRTTAGLNYKFQSLLFGTENANNSQTDSVYDQHVITADVRSLYPLSRFKILTGSISLSEESTIDYDPGTTGGLNDPEKTQFSVSTSYRYQHSQRITYSANYQYSRKWYESQKESVFGVQLANAQIRQDYSHLLSAGVRYKWFEKLNLAFNLSYSENHSNHDGPNVGNNRNYDSMSASLSLSTSTRFRKLSQVKEKFNWDTVKTMQSKIPDELNWQ